MIYSKLYKKRFYIFLVICTLVLSITYLRTYFGMPEEITLIKGQTHIYNFKGPFPVSIKADKEGILRLNGGDITAGGNNYHLTNPLAFESDKKGSVELDIKILGLVPLRTLKVDIVENRRIVPCGNTIGVKLKLEGILVVGISDISSVGGKKATPAKDSGIRAGDLIMQADNRQIQTINELIDVIDNSKGNKIKIRYKRGGIYRDTNITPVKSSEDSKYHLRIWVRDNTAGIGTLTFYDPNTRYFGALGHGITDIDTGTIMPVRTGEILESNILAWLL